MSEPYRGPERRRSSVEERQEYRRAHGLPAPEPPPVSWMAAATVYLGMLPKPVLVLATITLSLFAGRQAGIWIKGVDGHIEASHTGYARIQKLEVATQTTAGEVEKVQGEVNDLRDELREMRKDQLTYYRWQAEQWGDRGKMREVDVRLRQMEQTP